jgi:hypothetical protein
MSLLPQLSSYTGMLLVGLFIPVLLKRKSQMALYYEKVLSTEQEEEDRTDIFKGLVTIRTHPLLLTFSSLAFPPIIIAYAIFCFIKNNICIV